MGATIIQSIIQRFRPRMGNSVMKWDLTTRNPMTRRRRTHDLLSPIGAPPLRILLQTCEAVGVDHPFARRSTALATWATNIHASAVAGRAFSTGSAERRHGRHLAASPGTPVGAHGVPVAATIRSASRTALAISAATIQGSPAAGGAGGVRATMSNARRLRAPTPGASAEMLCLHWTARLMRLVWHTEACDHECVLSPDRIVLRQGTSPLAAIRSFFVFWRGSVSCIGG